MENRATSFAERVGRSEESAHIQRQLMNKKDKRSLLALLMETILSPSLGSKFLPTNSQSIESLKIKSDTRKTKTKTQNHVYATGMYCVETRDAVKPTSIHRTAMYIQKLSGPKGQWCQAEKSSSSCSLNMHRIILLINDLDLFDCSLKFFFTSNTGLIFSKEIRFLFT